ncbi:Subtilisin-like protease SBT3.5 [Capsicum chinense]|nr:Subtilisin-like protease SBT3.5 [Capsicum chinense]
MDANKSSGKRPIFGKVFRRNKKRNATTSSLSPRFNENSLSQPNGFDVGVSMELDHETLNRRYNNFEEDIPEEDDIEVQELGETPTPTSPVTKIPIDDEVLPPLPEFSRAKGLLTTPLRKCNTEFIRLENEANAKKKRWYTIDGRICGRSKSFVTVPRTVEELFTDFKARRAGLIKALTADDHLLCVALLKSLHPDWSPAAIKSAIMTTVGLKDPHSGLPIIAEGMPFWVADPFDFGSGLVNAHAANNSGLIYDMGTFDYILYLRSMGYKSSHISNMIDEGAASFPIKRPSILDVNLSSLIVPSLKDTVNVRRTVTNIGPENSKYEAIIEPPPGITIKQVRDRLLAKVENRAANTDGQAIKLQYTHSPKLKSLDAQEFAEAYKSFHVGEKLANELATPRDKSKSHPAALSTKKNCIGMKQMFKIVQTVLPSRTSTPDSIGIVQIHWRWESLAYDLDHLHRGCEEMVDLGLFDLTIDAFCEFNSCE